MTARLVLDFRLGGMRPSAADLAERAADAGAAFVALSVPNEETPQGLVDGVRIADLSRSGEALRKKDVGLFLRLEGTLPLPDLRDALEIGEGTQPATLRERILVVVRDERTGKRLRRETPEFPSAYELGPRDAPGRWLLRFVPPMMQRAAADAEDLVVPAGRMSEGELTAKYVPALARRGARLWISDVEDADRERLAALPVGGIVVRTAFARR